MKKYLLLLFLIPIALFAGGPAPIVDTDSVSGLGSMATQNSNAVSITGGVASLTTLNGVTPLTAAEKTQALVGSSTVDFDAQNGSFTGRIDSIGAKVTTDFRNEFGAMYFERNTLVLSTGETYPLEDIFPSTGNTYDGSLYIVGAAGYGAFRVYMNGSGNSVATETYMTAFPYFSAHNDTPGLLCVIPDGDLTYSIKNNIAATMTLLLEYSGRL